MIDVWNVTVPPLTGDAHRRAYCYVPNLVEDDPELRFPVLYMFDGHNVFFDDHATYGKSWGMLEFLEENNVPLIVAAVECDHGENFARLHEYCPFPAEMPGAGHLKGRGKKYMDWLVSDFKSVIDARFPTRPDREHTFIAGSSMGGLMSLYAVVKYNKVFSRCAALSPSVWFCRDRLFPLLRSTRMGRDTVIYMDYGQNELDYHPDMAASFAEAASIFTQRKLNVTARIVPDGEHTEASWERQIPIFMDTLFYGLE